MFSDFPDRRLTPNPECVMLCPVLEGDRLTSGQGNPIADEDYERHCVQSNDCDGTQFDANKMKFKCPLFGVDARI
jgi:hypothetical protein